MRWVFTQQAEHPLIARPEVNPRVNVNAPVELPPAPKVMKPLHAGSTARAVAEQAVMIRPGEWRLRLPPGWRGSVAAVHAELTDGILEGMLKKETR